MNDRYDAGYGGDYEEQEEQYELVGYDEYGRPIYRQAQRQQAAPQQYDPYAQQQGYGYDPYATGRQQPVPPQQYDPYGTGQQPPVPSYDDPYGTGGRPRAVRRQRRTTPTGGPRPAVSSPVSPSRPPTSRSRPARRSRHRTAPRPPPGPNGITTPSSSPSSRIPTVTPKTSSTG